MTSVQTAFKSENTCGVDCTPLAVGKNFTIWVKRIQDKCLDMKAPIPGAPLWNFIRAYKGSPQHAEELQAAIDYLVCKAKHKTPFNSDEIEFCKELYEALWYGGKWSGYSEAALLANHYVNGDGADVELDGGMYKNSKIVQDVMIGMKKYIGKKITIKSTGFRLLNNNSILLKKDYYKKLIRGNGRTYQSDGWLVPDSQYVILTEQTNQRLKNADNRFFLDSDSKLVGDKTVETVWRVESIYDFTPFDYSSATLTNDDKRNITEIPISKGVYISLPDGLSHYMTTNNVNVATEFKYTSEWTEVWNLE